MNYEEITLLSGEGTVPFCIERLIERLQSNDCTERQTAREALGRIGKQAVPYISILLKHKERQIRWEACKTLQRIRDLRTASMLTEMLMDDDMDVRWVAADALIELEYHAVEPLLEMLEEHFDSAAFREAAHHVLHSLKEIQMLDKKTEGVLDALKVNELPSKAAFAAIQALDYVRSPLFKKQRYMPNS